MGAGRLVFKNFLSLTFSNAISKVAGLFAVIYLARILGPAEFGKMNFALAIVSYFSILAHLGLGTIGIRELAQNPGNRTACINQILSLKLLLGCASFLLLLVFSFFLRESAEMKLLVVFYGLTMFTSNVLTFDWVLQGIEKMEYLGTSTAVQGLLYLSLILLVVKGSADLTLIPWILLAAQGGAVAFMVWTYRRLAPEFGFRFALPENWAKLREAVPVAAWGILSVVILNSGVTIMGFIKSPVEVGYFSAAYRIIWILVEMTVFYIAAVFPAMSRHHALSPDSFRRIMNMTLKWMTLICFPAIAGLYMLSVPVISLIYGQKFGAAAPVLAALAVTPYLIFLMSLFSHALIAAHRQDKVLKLSAFHAALTVALNLALIPPYGAMGLAGAAITATVLTNYLYARELGRLVKLDPYRPLKPLLACLVMVAALRFVSHLSLFISIPVGAAVYAAVILLSREVTLEDLRGIKGMLFPAAQAK